MNDLANRLSMASSYLQKVLILRAPKDTGNLAFNSIRLVAVDSYNWQIVIGGEIAEYAIYTNEPWISERWGGKVNPNEGWVNRAIEDSVGILQSILDGKISQKEVEAMNASVSNQIANNIDDMIRRIENDHK